MEDTWRIKCSSSAWTPPPPPSSSPAPPPLPPPATPQLSTLSSANQMNKNPRQPFHPFIVQGVNLESHPAVQEPLVFHTLNLDFAAKLGKTELETSFLALLSANPQHLPSEFSQPAKLHSHTGGSIIGSSASPGAQVMSIPTLSAHSTSGSMWNAKIPSLVQSRPSLISNSTKAPALHNSVRLSTFHCNASASTKPVPHQAFQGAGAGKPSISCTWSSTSRPENASQIHPLNIQTSQRMPTEVGPAVPGHDSARSRGRPRVICMNSVGELFLSELGLLGVICFCHGLRMSVAKFCEHSGSSANPGEVVCLENGMTVARWRKLCFGNNAPDDYKGWDWSASPSTKTGFIGSKGSTLPTLPQNPGTVDSVQTFVGLHKSGDPWNKTLYAKPPGTGVRQAAIKNPSTEVSDNMYQRNRSEAEGFTSPSQSHMPVFAKDHIVHAIKESPDYLNPEASCAALNKGEQNAWFRLVTNIDNCKGKLGTHSLLYPCSNARSLSCELNSSRNNFGSENYVLARDGRSSNIDLRLGQPSQVHTSLSSLSTAMNPLQFGAGRIHQKSQVNFPLTEKTDYPIETRQPKIGLWCTSSEPSISNRGQSQHAVGSSKNSSHSEPKDLTGNSTKNSLISLFLSHLNTGGSTTSQLTTNVNDSKYSMHDPAAGKCNLSKHINDIHGGNQRNNFVDGSNLSNNIHKGKPLRHFENGSYETANANYMVHNKKTADSKCLMPATGGQCLYGGSSVDQRRFSLHFNQPSSILQTGSDSMNFNQHGKIPIGKNRDHCNHATNSSVNLVSYAGARPDPLNSGTPKNLSSSNSQYISETTSAVTHTKSIDHSQHMTDDNLKFLALRHLVEFSKQEQSSAILEVSPRHQRLCCHSGIELPRNLCKGDSAAAEDLRQRTSDIQQSASECTVRSLQSRANCFSGNGAEMLAAKTGTRGNEYCKCATLTQRISQCSKEQDISTCHVCCADEHPHLRLRRISNYSSGSVKQIFDQKEQFTSFCGKCCCSMLSKHLTGCCFTGHFSSSDSNKKNVCGRAIVKHITETCDEIHRSQDSGNVDLCECTKKHFVMKNDCQTGLWRDVPAKKTGHSDAMSVDKTKQMLKASEGTGDQLPGTACKGFEGSRQEFDSMNEQQMSNFCSGSSAPAVTEISVEVNKVNYCATNVEDNKTAFDFVADEGSGVEKCGSSDETLNIRECEENCAVNCRVDPAKSGSSLPSQTSGGFIDELRLLDESFIDELRLETSSNKEKVRNQMHVQCADQENNEKRMVWKSERRKEQIKMNKLDVSVPKPINSESSKCISHLNWEFSSPDESKASSQSETVMQKSRLKRNWSSLSSIEPPSLKAKSHHNIMEFDKIQSVNDHQSLRTLAVSSGEVDLTVHREQEFAKQKGIRLDSEKPPKYMSLSHIAKSNNHETEIVDKKIRPVVCGKSGIISNGGLTGQKKPPKIVPLSLILKRSKRCDVNEYGAKPKKTSTSESRKMLLKGNSGCSNELSSSKLQCESEDSKKNGTYGTTVRTGGSNKRCSSKSDEHVDGFSMIENEGDSGNYKEQEPILRHKYKISQTRPRYKEARKCSLHKLLGKDKHATMPSSAPSPGASCGLTINGTGDKPKAYPSAATSDSLIDVGLGKRSLNNEDRAGEPSQINTRRSGKVRKCQPFFLKSDAFCCVCGSSNKEEFNCILECNRCLVRVHQACYGISKVPRGQWFCRPCKTNSLNTVCVLCGYEGGAMTKAVKSQNIVKSLLKAWNFGTFMKSVFSSETVKGESLERCFVIEASTHDNSGSVTAARSVCTDAFLEAAVDLISENQTNDRMAKGLQLYNSITAGVLDPSVTQWVHMVCGLWTPGTRCPNVDTMSAFDVSGASAARKSTVCSMCNRPGGCCIQCRVMKCSVHFHPWCAHQKGLLQSEIKGDDNAKVGFYGRCMLHAALDGIHIDSHPVYTEAESPKGDWSCARTEGVNGQKSEGFKPNHWRPPNNDNGGCIVSQEQINAWLHINGQKSCTRTVVKPSCSDVEYDFRKEYFRYKQSKAWKNLVVYKSGIHALGLYTSQLIARGAMVVEYVGEIVGLRVADKREIEYQSGRRVQYKSACYFFRIDKEHIIDATRKGGIARFVNHSCQPNCVAKVISVRNEKKVVFFSERDINPGEEITYDYHFNSEDEGLKIPCYCNSKNCRRFLN